MSILCIKFWPTKLWPGRRKHVIDDLSAFADGVLPAEQAARISEHLDQCQSCREEYKEIRFGAALATHLVGVKAPEGTWSSLVSRLEDAGAVSAASASPGWQPMRWAAAVVLAGLVSVVAYLGVSRLSSRSGRSIHASTNASAPPVSPASATNASTPAPAGREQFDLAAYVVPVMAAPRDASFRVVSTALPRFTSVDRQEALRTAGLSASARDMTPLPGYHLVSYRASHADGQRVVQLVYRSGEQGFSVFVAPRGVDFSFGTGSCVETHVGGIRCQKLECPYQETYSFSQGSYRCVLVSKSLDATQAATVMNYFMSAQKGSKSDR